MENQNDQINANPSIDTAPVQQNTSNPFFKTFLKNKYMMAILAAIVLLLAIIFSIIFMNAKSSSNATTTPTPTSSSRATSPSNAVSGPATSQTPSVGTVIVITPNPVQETLIKNQTQPQISPNVGVPYTVAKINQYGSDWALMKITNPDVGTAYVVVQKVNGKWTVLLGPGTHFDAQDLQGIGAPQEILNDANKGI